MSKECEHKTAVVIHEAAPSAPYNLFLCTYGCHEYLAGVERDGVMQVWAVSELIAQVMEEAAHDQQ